MTKFDTKKNDKATRTTSLNMPEAVGVFSTYDALQAAYYDLRMAGFSRYDISLLASQEVLEDKLGHGSWRVTDLEDDPDAPRAAFVSEEAIGELEGAIVGGSLFVGSAVAMTTLLTAASTAAASIAAVAIGGIPAAVLGVLFARRVGKHHSDYYAGQIARGGILLWVRYHSPEQEVLAVKIMKGHSGHDVHVHPWSE